MAESKLATGAFVLSLLTLLTLIAMFIMFGAGMLPPGVNNALRPNNSNKA
jgi:hypothetical protein